MDSFNVAAPYVVLQTLNVWENWVNNHTQHEVFRIGMKTWECMMYLVLFMP